MIIIENSIINQRNLRSYWHTAIGNKQPRCGREQLPWSRQTFQSIQQHLLTADRETRVTNITPRICVGFIYQSGHIVHLAEPCSDQEQIVLNDKRITEMLQIHHSKLTISCWLRIRALISSFKSSLLPLAAAASTS